jgi:hypothetical protein
MAMNLRLPLILLTFLTPGCSKQPHPQHVESSTTPGVATSTPSQNEESLSNPVPDEEPPEEVLSKLEFQRYDQLEEMGGMPVTMTATGKSLTLHPKLYEVRKEKCSPTPQAPKGWYECELIIKLSLAPDGSDPSEQGERIGVKWSPEGEWVLQ